MKTAVSLALALGMVSAPALAAPYVLSDAQMDRISAGAGFDVINEVSDQAGMAHTTDADLVNAWGLAAGPGGPLWVANNGTGTATIYSSTTFGKIPLTVNIPAPGGGPAAPTGQEFGGPDIGNFEVSEGGKHGHSVFLFDTEDGTILGWAPKVDLFNAITAVDGSAQGDVFKGLTMSPSHTRLFAADFANGVVHIYDGSFNEIGTFTDPQVPKKYAPFNVQVLNGKLYVAFAKRQTGSLDEQHGAGLGYVDIFDFHGHMVDRLVGNGALNAPWGLAIAPASWGSLAGALLVGNFGDGTINAYNADTGASMGPVTKPNGDPVWIDGLWALRQGNDGSIVFSSGPNDESHGLVGAIVPDSAAASWAFQSHSKMALASPGASMSMHFGH
jgi:uncharacterized protein (TIGR03118 family)